MRTHQLESRMRENRPYGSEGGVAERRSLPLSGEGRDKAGVRSGSRADVSSWGRTWRLNRSTRVPLPSHSDKPRRGGPEDAGAGADAGGIAGGQ